MGLDANDFDVTCVHHIHVAIVECVGIIAVHYYHIGLIELALGMEVVQKHFAIFGKKVLINVPLLDEHSNTHLVH